MCTFPAPLWYSEVVLHRCLGTSATCSSGQELGHLQAFPVKRMKGFEPSTFAMARR
jgi:hypothetical protein